MRIVIDHLTRMTGDHICVAGIDTDSGRHIRPVAGRLTRATLEDEGGLFAVGGVVDLANPRPTGEPPEVEDTLFDVRGSKRAAGLSAAAFWNLLQITSRGSLSELFGMDLKKAGRSGAAVAAHKGAASLGLLRPKPTPELWMTVAKKLRMRVADGTFDLDLSLTDLRLVGSDHITPNLSAIRTMQTALTAGTAVVLAVGLGRPFQATGDDQERHWLQVNNIHLASDPLGAKI